MDDARLDAIPKRVLGLGRRSFLKGLAAGGAAASTGLWGGVAWADEPEKPAANQNAGFGPTDIGATVGNQRLSVAVNPRGGLSLFRWPSTSYWEQIRYRTVSRQQPRLGLSPNEGAFSGLVLALDDGSQHTVWLRDLTIQQCYASEDSDTVVTHFQSGQFGLVLELTDIVPQDGDVLLRHHALRLNESSPVKKARLIAFSNFNPIATKRKLPVRDWALEKRDTDTAHYDRSADALFYSITEEDQSTGKRSTVAIAIGANRPSLGHQVGGDQYAEKSPKSGAPVSAYDDASDGKLSGNDRYGPAEVDTALELPFDDNNEVTVIFSVGGSTQKATRLLARYRNRNAVDEAKAKRRDYLHWLADAPLPSGAPPEVVRLSKRALICMRQVIDESAGSDGRKVAIMASFSTQPPYSQDWIRDGAFFNEALEEIGHPDLAARHNQFYAEVQYRQSEGAPAGSPSSQCYPPDKMEPPAGSWAMMYYADGIVSGDIPWEIDEVAFGLWALYRHFQWEKRRGNSKAARTYLRQIYPAIHRTADFLVVFRDPVTKLPPKSACEDDNRGSPGKPTTMHASGPALLAMRSAEDAARELGEGGDLDRYTQRRKELEQAIDEHYSPDGSAWTDGFGDGGWALWPVRVKHSYGNSRMAAQALATWHAVAPSFLAPHGPRKSGSYESKALLGLAHYYQAVAPGRLGRLKRGLKWIANVQAATLNTGILGESWQVRDGRVATYIAQPHVWEQILFYLSALETYGRTPYQPDAGRFNTRGNAGAGCTMGSDRTPFDPMLALLVGAAGLAVKLRRRNTDSPQEESRE